MGGGGGAGRLNRYISSKAVAERIYMPVILLMHTFIIMYGIISYKLKITTLVCTRLRLEAGLFILQAFHL